jgi:hypothetical protein
MPYRARWIVAGQRSPASRPRVAVGAQNGVNAADLVFAAMRRFTEFVSGCVSMAGVGTFSTHVTTIRLPGGAPGIRLARLLARSDRAKDAEILMLRHQVPVPSVAAVPGAGRNTPTGDAASLNRPSPNRRHLIYPLRDGLGPAQTASRISGRYNERSTLSSANTLVTSAAVPIQG